MLNKQKPVQLPQKIVTKCTSPANKGRAQVSTGRASLYAGVQTAVHENARYLESCANLAPPPLPGTFRTVAR